LYSLLNSIEHRNKTILMYSFGSGSLASLFKLKLHSQVNIVKYKGLERKKKISPKEAINIVKEREKTFDTMGWNSTGTKGLAKNTYYVDSYNVNGSYNISLFK
jgi:3-hydroxy-3-methylglutaryl CoA synthase